MLLKSNRYEKFTWLESEKYMCHISLIISFIGALLESVSRTMEEGRGKWCCMPHDINTCFANLLDAKWCKYVVCVSCTMMWKMKCHFEVHVASIVYHIWHQGFDTCISAPDTFRWTFSCSSLPTSSPTSLITRKQFVHAKQAAVSSCSSYW